MGGTQGPELRPLGGTGVQRGSAVAAEGRDEVGPWVAGKVGAGQDASPGVLPLGVGGP